MPYIKYNQTTGELEGEVGYMNSNDPDVIWVDPVKQYGNPPMLYSQMVRPRFDLMTKEPYDLGQDPTALQAAKSSKLAQISEELTTRIQTGRGTVTVNGIVWDAGKRYQGNIEDEIAPVVAGRLPESSLHQWKDNAGNFHVLLLADFQLLLAAIEDWIRSIGEQLYAVKWQHEAAINALTTDKDVDAYDETTLWPV